MCRRVECRDCGKPDWAGCGAHIESVLGNVPKKERCACRDDGTRANQMQGGSWLNRFIGGGSK